MCNTDQYLTIREQGQGLYKEKGSKFISIAVHVESEEEVKASLLNIKKQYHDARHHCYAYRLGVTEELVRSSDDGEPSGTAGKPILNQIYSYEMYHALVVVVRYFGGTKLGVSGLVTAYKTVAREALESAGKEVKFLTVRFQLVMDYPMVDQVMRLIKEENLTVVKQEFEMRCKFIIEVRVGQKNFVLSRIALWHDVELKEL
ncbi:MAG: hypothetical protein A2W85_17405 [Bacteroidetes bacterium GWF2_41_31]|nr:MAG: hypothetical protein A2W85_17405 [Bacteroidetes bacterium GWF2_41_31]